MLEQGLTQVETLNRQVYSAIKDAIISATLKPRQVVTIAQLANMLHVGRTPVRDALLTLEREQWVTIIPRKGAMINPSNAKSVAEIIEIQVLLEGYTAYRAAEVMTNKQISEASKLLADSEVLLKQKNYGDFSKAGDRFHMLIAESVGNDRLTQSVLELMEAFERIKPFMQYSSIVNLEDTLAQHKKIFEAIRAHDRDTAKEEMEYHMGWFKEKLLEELFKYESLG